MVLQVVAAVVIIVVLLAAEQDLVAEQDQVSQPWAVTPCEDNAEGSTARRLALLWLPP